MQINAFRAIRFGENYWKTNAQTHFSMLNSNDKIKQTGNNLTYLNEQINKGIAKIDSAPSLYVLRITSASKRVTSIIGEIDYNEKSVLFMNENIHPQKLEHYKSMFQNYKIQTSPVLTFYKNGIPINTIVDDILQTSPANSVYIDGMLYELWCVSDYKQIEQIKNSLKKINHLYIADGHHRFSIFTGRSSKTSAKLIISVTDANSILLKSCHRIVCGAISQNWRDKILQVGAMEQIQAQDEAKGRAILLFPQGEQFAVDINLSEKDKNIFDIVKQDIIEFGFGVNNFEENVFPLPGNITPNDFAQIFNLYRNASVAIFVPSINITDFLDVIDNGHKLPATSTWFEPKIVDGFIVRKFF